MSGQFSECVPTLQSNGLIPKTCQAILLVGSAARGWANEDSDYDIYLVSTEQWHGESGSELKLPLDPVAVPVHATHVAGRRWELKYWLDTQVDQMLAKVAWEQYSRGLVAGQLLTDVEEVFLERLVGCVTLAGADWTDKRRRELTESAFSAFVVTRSLAWTDDSIEDAAGQLKSGDTKSAVLSARKAFGHTVDALLESNGEYGYYTPKWRARRMMAVEPAELKFADYWKFETMRGLDPDNPRQWVEEVITVCRRLAAVIEVPAGQ